MLIRESNYLDFDMAISTSSFGLSKVQRLKHSVLMVKDCKIAFVRGLLFFSVVSRSPLLVTSGFFVFKALC